ncbi:MAG TPA: sugar phosphate isomerase/epimerase family protein [Chloroflexia bacterium]|nr:sugar phosphate isomerase/epimerase family protein [Chloroflexia bacterium]
MDKGVQLLCSTGAFSRDPDLTSHEAILEYGSQLPVDGLEVIFYPSWYSYTGCIAADLAAAGVRFPVVHAEKSIGPLLGTAEEDNKTEALRRLEVNCRFASQVGARLLVLHLWGFPGSDEHFDRNLGELPACLDIADAERVRLAIETVPCSTSNPLTNVSLAVERDARCLVALDTEFLAMHGQVDACVAPGPLWAGRKIAHVHVKDYDGRTAEKDGRRRYLHPGEGRIDFGRLFCSLRTGGFDGTVSLESSAVSVDGRVDTHKIGESLQVLRQFIEAVNIQE